MRTQNSIKNMVFGIGSQLSSTIIAFITRTVFIHMLGLEYLGIEGLFTNILSILSLANLGMDSAIIFSLYKPLNEKNEVEIKGYMDFYKKVYRVVGIFILIAGLILIPYIPNIINQTVQIKESLIVIYVLFLINSSSSYFYVYKQSILQANQQSYLISKIHTYFIFISNTLQIGTLVIFKEYILFLIVQILCRIFENIVISIKAEKEFPFLKDKNIKGILKKDKKEKLYKDIYSMLLYKISGTVINSTDNIIISYFVGVIYVGIYSNYLLIISTVKTFTSYIFSSLTASVGNLIVSSQDDKKEFMFRQILFTSFWIYGFCSISFYILFNDFMVIWLKDNTYLLDSFTIIIVIINFYTAGMQSASTMYRDTTGLFSVGKYRPIIAAIINTMISIILAPKLGIAGVLLGTIISRLSVYFWFDPYVINKHIFNKNSKDYFVEYTKYTLVVILVGCITYIISNLLDGLNIYISFILKILVCMVIPNILFMLIYRKSIYLKYLKDIFFRSINMKNKKNKLIRV